MQLLTTDDPDCLARSIDGWSQHYEQLHSGRFAGKLTQLSVATARLFVEQTNLALRQICTVPQNYVWFGLPLGEQSDRYVRINGAPVSDDRIAVRRGGEAFELLTPDRLQFWGIVVQEQALLEYARQVECEAWLARALDNPLLLVSEERKRNAQQSCRHMLDNWQAERQELSPAATLNLTEAALGALFSLFQHAQPQVGERVSVQHRHRLVERADAYVRAHGDRLVTVSELCTALSVSRRALQGGFQELLGVSPHAYIRAISLNNVRHQLNSEDSPYRNVQDAAAAFGFWHMSQFAVDYRQLFGELPSETLKRRGSGAVD